MNIRPATDKDNKALCELCEQAIEGNIRIALERSPDFFAGSSVQFEQVEVYVVTNQNEYVILAVFAIGIRRVWLNGAISPVRYFSDLRLAAGINRARVLFNIYNFINKHGFLLNNVAQTIIFQDNIPMLKLIELLNMRVKGNHSFKYFNSGDYISQMLSLENKQAKTNHNYNIRRAEEQDVDKVNRFLDLEGSKIQFFPYYRLDDLNTDYMQGLNISDFYIAEWNNEIVGICGIWDQFKFKQTRISGYSKIFRLIRPLNNALHKLCGTLKLPSEGKVIPYLNLHCVLVKNHDVDVFKGLLNRIIMDHQKSNYHYLLCGMNETDPLQKAFKSYYLKQTIYGKHFLVGHHGMDLSKTGYYLEVARI